MKKVLRTARAIRRSSKRTTARCNYCDVEFCAFFIATKFCSERCLRTKDDRNYYRRHKKKLYKKARTRLLNNWDKVREYQQQYRQKNKEKIREHKSKWDKLNRGYKTYSTATYRARKKRQAPPWLTTKHLQFIKNIYKEANRLQKVYGIRMSVDHILPLKGKNVSGLHVPWNLQILPLEENSGKGNREDFK